MWALKQAGKVKMPDGSYKRFDAGAILPADVVLTNPELWCTRVSDDIVLKTKSSSVPAPVVKPVSRELPSERLDLALDEEPGSEDLLQAPTKAKKKGSMPKFADSLAKGKV